MGKNRETLSRLVYRVNKLLKQELQSELKPFDITTDQWTVLGQIYHNSGKYNQKELAKISFKQRAAITRMIDLMEKDKLIERQDSPTDRREYLLYITDIGKKLYEKTLPSVEESYDHIYKILKLDEIEIVIKLMSKLEKGLFEQAK